MAYLAQLLTLAGVVLVAYILPGPDFLAVSSNALASRRAGLLAGLGVATGCVVWASLAVFGLGLVMARLSWLYTAIRLAGGVYLIVFGIRMLLARRPAASATVERSRDTARGAYRRGLAVNLSNPKAAVYFGSLFVGLLPVGAPTWVLATVVGIVGLLAVGWFSTLAWMFSGARIRDVYDRIRRPINALMGLALAGLGTKLVLER